MGNGNKERTVVLVMKDQDGLDITNHTLILKTSLPDDELLDAVRAAAKDYLNTDEGRETYLQNCDNFNYGDFITCMSNKFCEPHGFTMNEGQLDTIEVDFNEQLAEPDENPGFTVETMIGIIRILDEDIDDIMDSAMHGCTYWCERAEVVDGEYLGEYASEQISRGGSLMFYPEDDETGVKLTKAKFETGMCLFLVDHIESVFSDNVFEKLKSCTENGRINPGMIDGNDADTILQLALFNEIVYS